MPRANRWRVDQPWTIAADKVLEKLEVSRDQGLSQTEAQKRRKECGPNRLRRTQTRSAWLILLDQFKSLITLLLALATLLAVAFGNMVEGLAIAAALLINALIGFGTELKAVRSMESLYKLSQVTTKVRREGQIRQIAAEELVPGDIVILEGGDVVSADLRLWEANKLQADESALTGESVPVSKAIAALGEDVPLAERQNLMFNSTSVTRGSGAGVVVATGMDTELGQISSLVEEAEAETTPLEKRLDRLGYRLIWLTLALGLLVTASGLLAGKDTLLVIETAIALAVAAIPEGLPIVATLALARGMRRMARRHALVNRLSAIETLGAINIIFTDKTGTLTENRMTVNRLALMDQDGKIVDVELSRAPDAVQNPESDEFPGNQLAQEALVIGVLCNNASLQGQNHKGDSEPIGDPLEVAFLEAGARVGLDQEHLLEDWPEGREEAFDPETKMMATFHQKNGEYLAAVKGAPEAVLGVCSHVKTLDQTRPFEKSDKSTYLEANQRLAGKGLRMMALAEKQATSNEEDPYKGLTLLGLAGLVDPPRQEVPQAIAACQRAGIRLVMGTGDQPATAHHIAQAVGLIKDEQVEVIQGSDLANPDAWSQSEEQRLVQAPIFARVSPKQKLDLIALHQKRGSIVAMTGDGVNDAPGLKKADIGIAMGKRGTQVAREAADMVLTDDALGSIMVAIEYGRAIFGNIRKFILFLLSGNVSEILIVVIAWLVGAPLPLWPLQILYLNMIGDVFPALALGVGPGNPAAMERPPPDPQEPILSGRHWFTISFYGVLIASVVLGTFALALQWLQMDIRLAVTISFLTLAFSRLWHVFNMRDAESGLISNEITRNPYVWGALVLCTGLLLLAVYLPVLASVLHLINPGALGWGVIILASLIPWMIAQPLKSLGLRWI
ncbi:MAG: cation-transporting P-type ATPase [Desulfobacca sp.]|nr:cation-transporting P-type ATPase [Desulfobacca sp.]